MSTRFDVIAPRRYKQDGEEKTAWDRVGVAFEERNGDGMNVTLQTVPLPQVGDDGALSIRLIIRRPKERT